MYEYMSLYIHIYFFKFIYFLVALGLRCCVRAFSSCVVAVRGLLIAVASLALEHGL